MLIALSNRVTEQVKWTDGQSYLKRLFRAKKGYFLCLNKEVIQGNEGGAPCIANQNFPLVLFAPSVGPCCPP